MHKETGNDSFLCLMSVHVCVMREENVFPVKSVEKSNTHPHESTSNVCEISPAVTSLHSFTPIWPIYYTHTLQPKHLKLYSLLIHQHTHRDISHRIHWKHMEQINQINSDWVDNVTGNWFEIFHGFYVIVKVSLLKAESFCSHAFLNIDCG